MVLNNQLKKNGIILNPDKKSVYKTPEGSDQIICYYETTLDNHPLVNEKITLQTSFGKTFILAFGDPSSQPIVFLHGTATNSAVWLGDIKMYKSFRIYAIDIPGEPGKSEEYRLSFKNDQYVKWLNDVLTQLKIKNPILIGMSLGGGIAAHYASRFPQVVNKLVLLCPGGIVNVRLTFFAYLVVLLFFKKTGTRIINKKVLMGITPPNEYKHFGNLIDKYFIHNTETIPILKASELSALGMPVMIIIGAKDVFYNAFKMSKRIKNFVPKSEIVILQNTGHALINTSKTIIKFLLKVPNSSEAK